MTFLAAHRSKVMEMKSIFDLFLDNAFLHVVAIAVTGIIGALGLITVSFNNEYQKCGKHIVYPMVPRRILVMNILLWPFQKLGFGKFKPLSLEDLKRDAIQKEHGLDDFGNKWHEEPLQFMIERINQASLSPVGYMLTRELFTRRLRVKLRLTAELKLGEVEEYCQKFPVQDPVFIVGLPRTGTTYLHRLLSLDPQSRAPLTWELFDPTRRILDDPVCDQVKRIEFCQRNIDFLISLTPHLNLVHDMGAEQPEECLMALGLDAPLLFDTFHLFLESPETAYAWDCTEAYLNYAKVLQLLQYHASLKGGAQASNKHWVLKCPVHLGLLRYLSLAFPGPNAKVIWTHRSVKDSIPSLARLIRVGMDMTLAGRIDLGTHGQHCLNFVEEWLQRGDAFFNSNEKSVERVRHPVTHVQYDDLTKDPIRTIKRVYNDLGLHFTPEYETILQEYIWMDTRKRGEQEGMKAHTYPTGYSLEEYGLSEADLDTKLGWYSRKFSPAK